MNEFEKGLAGYIGEERLLKLQRVKIGIGGAGGLGSNCAFNLVRSGFKRLKVVDFDVVEPSNLNRQLFFLDQLGVPKVKALETNLRRINPDIDVKSVQGMVTKKNVSGLFADCDVVVEAFDKVEYKILIVENYFSSGKLLVSASGLAGWGNSDDIRVKKVHDSFYMVGDFETEASGALPPISPRVNIAAAKQADIILDYYMSRV